MQTLKKGKKKSQDCGCKEMYIYPDMNNVEIYFNRRRLVIRSRVGSHIKRIDCQFLGLFVIA